MRSPYRYATVALCFTLVTAPVATAQDITQRDYVRQLESAPSDAIVQYCRAKAPEAKGQIDEGYANYLSSLDKAMNMWVSSNPELERSLGTQMSPSDAKAAQASMRDISSAVLSRIKQYDAHKYCAWMATKLKSTTPQSLLGLLHEYEARARAASGARSQ